MTCIGSRTGLGLFLLIASLAACVPLRSPTAPLFVPDAADLLRYRELVRAQEAHLAACAERQVCDRLHFTRALVALYENRAEAAKHFQAVVTAAPDSRLASSSLAWLRALDDAPPAGSTNPLAGTTESLVRDLLDRELAIQQLSQELDGPAIRTLQRGLKARDKQIEELTKQLDALKRIDQEMQEHEKRRPKKKPSGRSGSAPGKESQP